MLNIKINGTDYQTEAGKTILQACRDQGVEIPTLCNDERLKPFGSCLLCRIEVKGARGTMLACGTEVTEGMEITTESDAISKARRMNIELLLSQHYGDCKAPCSLTCPANIDIQGYIAHIANGQFDEALKLIKDRNPLPVVCGRVCTRPCEDACRRNLVDERVGIDYLKRFVADLDLESSIPYLPEKKPATGKKAAVIGAGPAGLTCAWYLAAAGHEVTIFERHPKGGGMLRYGIPAYRMPREALDQEIAIIEKLGVKIQYNTAFGKDVTWESLKAQGFGALFLGVGSQVGQPLGCNGEDVCYTGILRGVDFLGRVGGGEKLDFTGKTVMVVGGGNTAIDAARTSLRLGAGKVVLVYRRGKSEMPAHVAEVEEAELEGVQFELLANPKKVWPEDGKVVVQLIRMELGAPDASGRRSPVEKAGSEYDMPADVVIAAIGQTQDLSFISDKFALDSVKNRITADEALMTTNLGGVFAGGDAVTGPQTAIKAIAAGRRAAMAMDQYLNGQEELKKPKEFYNHLKGKKLEDLDKAEFEQYEKLHKEAMPMLDKGQREHNFKEVELGFTEAQAIAEAKRCLSCGCKDVGECKLRDYATDFKAEQYHIAGELKKHPIDESHPYLVRDRNKCILCGRCIRICSEVQGAGALGFVSRGYNTTVEPSFSMPFGQEPNCIRCGQCVSSCPVGALTEKVPLTQSGPFNEKSTDSICSFCGEGCTVELRTCGKRFVRSTSSTEKGVNHGNLCEFGRFSNAYLNDAERLTTPRIKKNGVWTDASLEEALSAAAAGLKKAGKDTALYLSGNTSNEEAGLIRGIADALGSKNVLSFGIDPTAAIFYGAYPQLAVSGIDEVKEKDLFVVLGADLKNVNTNVFVAVRLARRNGVPVLESDKLTAEITEKVKAASKPLFVFGDAPDGAVLKEAAALAEAAGAKIYVPCMANTRGSSKFIDLEKCVAGPAGIPAKAALIFGEDPVGCGNAKAAGLLKNAAFSVVFDLYMTETAKLSDVVIPMSAVAENSGTFENAFGNVQSFGKALETGGENRQVLTGLLKELGGTETSAPAVTLGLPELASAKDRTAYQSDVVYAMLVEHRKHIAASAE
ncbi:formate dehydrogenase major subunit [Sporobacter termitidis DSM 10068]|uniref:Formate dehydrogenase major subunit n=1 Tax=Sporobacter termitidis DSM 10068 TaxID=1123282 RepID=A0A1M5VS88_9FIRM|nr:FAD-dependent oxidoreductase [Sporobacter termitidis]SHH77793.1 formate dehydrogenase major subunit [Sporobacter termitidis DSM 10068]